MFGQRLRAWRDAAIVSAKLLANVRELHRPIAVDGYPLDCANGNCDHSDECPEVQFLACGECNDINDTDSGFDVWPCKTIRVLNGEKP